MTIELYQWAGYSPEIKQELEEKVRAEHVPILDTPGSCVIDHWSGNAMACFRQHILWAFGHHFDDVGDINLYCVITRHDPERPQYEWAAGYPHTHGYVMRSLVHYLDPGAGAPLVIFGDDEEPTVVRPMQNVSVVFDGKLKHGFHNWEGPPRVALVAQHVPVNLQRGES